MSRSTALVFGTFRQKNRRLNTTLVEVRISALKADLQRVEDERASLISIVRLWERWIWLSSQKVGERTVEDVA